tara:strand:- start:257 stop:439 length:183 start_codon:yes stop_codon:yes gene_type:complete
MKITREMMMSWAETYDEAIDTLLWVANDGYDQNDMLESLEQCFIDNGLMSEQQFRKETNR